jgi:bifunctional non-homologous end joining protein LigD
MVYDRGVAGKQWLEVEGNMLALSNLEKLLYPGFSKAQVIDFYIRVAPVLLPHLKDRPVTLKRYPNGVEGKHFYEKNAPRFTPDWVETFNVPRRTGGEDIRYILINNLPTLVWSANLANLEIHPFLHRAPRIEEPTAVVFDLDPGEGADVLNCAEVAFTIKNLLETWKLEVFAKVSGSRGMQLYVPLNTRATYAATQPFAKAIAEYMEKEHPGMAVAKMAKAMRPGKVFIDWSQNSDFKTTVSVYSLRAKQSAPFVSMPVEWDELRLAVRKKNSAGLRLPPDAALKRIAGVGDAFAPVLKMKQKLPRDFTKALSH